jgi:hypothetical protein
MIDPHEEGLKFREKGQGLKKIMAYLKPRSKVRSAHPTILLNPK